jgi:hypothetical protein
MTPSPSAIGNMQITGEKSSRIILEKMGNSSTGNPNKT